jgi:hypothetical protein
MGFGDVKVCFVKICTLTPFPLAGKALIPRYGETVEIRVFESV